MMNEELLNKIDTNIELVKVALARNIMFRDYPYMEDCDRQYRILMFQKELEDWVKFRNMVTKYSEVKSN